MSVYQRGGVWWMNFTYRARRIQESTGQLTREAAEAVERQRRDQVRQEAHGVAIAPKAASPTFQDWAEVYYREAAKRVRRPERIKDLTRVALSFWGAKPAKPHLIYPDGEYHNLRLSDPIDDPSWLLKWEAWLAQPKRPRPRQDGRPTTAATWSGQTKNQYRSLLSQLYTLALRPAWRQTTSIAVNPCLGSERDTSGRRTTVLAIDDLRAILTHASWHLRLAMAVALLTPKLRLSNILALTFAQHFSPDLEWLTVHDHKTMGTGKPLVAYVPQQLRTILTTAKRRSARGFVVTYQGQPIEELRGAVRGAVERAAVDRPHLRYGRYAENGISFHTLRHSAATTLAALGIAPDVRKGVMGHEDIASTLWYTHLRPVHEITAAEALSDALPISDLVLVERRRPPVATPVSAALPESAKSRQKRMDVSRRARDVKAR